MEDELIERPFCQRWRYKLEPKILSGLKFYSYNCLPIMCPEEFLEISPRYLEKS